MFFGFFVVNASFRKCDLIPSIRKVVKSFANPLYFFSEFLSNRITPL